MVKTQSKPWDITEHLKTEADMVAYLDAALEEGDASLIAAALGDIARAKGMSQIAKDTGLGRESLYKTLSPNGNPEFATVLKVMGALGLQFHAGSVAANAVG
jgi:probable addiction module antidote protein